MPSEDEDSGDVWSHNAEQTKRLGKLVYSDVEHTVSEFASARNESARLIGNEEAHEHASGIAKDRLAQAVPGPKCDTKEWALSQKGRRSRGGKHSQHRRMRYE